MRDGFRTTPAAHTEAQELFGIPVISPRLVDPRFYHLDTALAMLDERTVAYYPEAFSPGSREVLRQLFPNAVWRAPPLTSSGGGVIDIARRGGADRQGRVVLFRRYRLGHRGY